MIDENKIAEAADLNADKYNPCRSTLDKEEACRASFKDESIHRIKYVHELQRILWTLAWTQI